MLFMTPQPQLLPWSIWLLCKSHAKKAKEHGNNLTYLPSICPVCLHVKNKLLRNRQTLASLRLFNTQDLPIISHNLR